MCGSLDHTYWESFKRVSCFPDQCGCESFVHDIILQPSNTYSNIVLLILGIYLLIKHFSLKDSYFQLGILVIYAAISSTFFHASFTYLSLLMDFTGISLLVFWILYKFMLRDKSVKFISFVLLGSYLVTIGLILLFEPMKYVVPFASGVTTFIYFSRNVLNPKQYLKNTNLLIATSVLFIGVVLFELDNFRIVCTPLNLHTVWHVLIPISIYNFYRFLKDSTLKFHT